MLALSAPATLAAREFHVGPGQPLASIGEVPWAKLRAGDRVWIHWRPAPYREKWVVNGRGTATAPIRISGVPGPDGRLPVIDGRDAKTAPGLQFWNQERGVVKIGGSSVPADTTPTYLVVEGLEIRSGHPDHHFYDSKGQKTRYRRNAAGIYVERAAFLVIRDCIVHDCANGLFIGVSNGRTKNILIEKNHVFGNGVKGSFYEHNAYTAAIGIIYQFNRFGPLRQGAAGNNVKDRSAGLAVRYNWIDGGNRALDLVDAEDSRVVVEHPSYDATHVYGNVLIKRDGGNNQVVHYGGDSGTTKDYRKGTLFFYNNTVYSKRSTTTTLLQLSTNDERSEVWNNIIFATAGGNRLAILGAKGQVTLRHNWINRGWVASHQGSSFSGSVDDDGSNVVGDLPRFRSEQGFDFRLEPGSPAIDAGVAEPSELPTRHHVKQQYVKHLKGRDRVVRDAIDLGAFESD